MAGRVVCLINNGKSSTVWSSCVVWSGLKFVGWLVVFGVGQFVWWVFVLIVNKLVAGFVLIDKVEVAIFASPA